MSLFPGMAPTLDHHDHAHRQYALHRYERVLLMYNSNVYVTADVLSTFEQRIGILSANYGMGASVSLFNSLIAFCAGDRSQLHKPQHIRYFAVVNRRI